MIRHVFVDIGGVLGTNGWDTAQRKAGIAKFNLDAGDYQYRHQEVIGEWEEGRISLSEYLDFTVFHRPRDFSREEFRDFMFAQSSPYPEAIAAVRALAETGSYALMTLNNESAELNTYRISLFGISDLFSAFLTSCWLNSLKPTSTFFSRAFGVAQALPKESLLIDDREQNIICARELGMQTIHCTDPSKLRDQMENAGLLNKTTGK